MEMLWKYLDLGNLKKGTCLRHAKQWPTRQVIELEWLRPSPTKLFREKETARPPTDAHKSFFQYASLPTENVQRKVQRRAHQRK